MAELAVDGRGERRSLLQTTEADDGAWLRTDADSEDVAAVGGVGSLLCQWANALGAIVIGIVSTEAKAVQAKEDGCHHVIMYTQEDFVTAEKELMLFTILSEKTLLRRTSRSGLGMLSSGGSDGSGVGEQGWIRSGVQ
ncbi:hypothetical protein Syun_012303 [Stephania yunnanensis]|uniref:Alcohol dehydrogenase-like C-terminal domain-containing protein n=1 Tax=Stephania yunnanensis TaxID=152371 RepID=A0AAP0JZ62_9MAGN